VIAVIDMVSTTVTSLAGAVPKVTVAPGTKSIPEIVIAVPPVIGPESGEIARTLVSEGWLTGVSPAAPFAWCSTLDDPIPAADKETGVGDDGDRLLSPQAAIEAITAAHAVAARQLTVFDRFFI
jgi:hypothetical protein